MLEINTKIVENANVSVHNMAIYLVQHGWQELPGKNDQLVVFQGINDDLGNPLLLVLPRQEGSTDAVRYLAQALEMVAFLENRSLEDSLHQIKNFSQDHRLISQRNSVNRTTTLGQVTRHVVWLGKKSLFCGNGTYGREITNGLKRRGHEISFMHFGENDSRDDVPMPFLYKSQVFTIPTVRAKRVLEKSLKRQRPDIVHASLSLSPLDFLLPEICQELDLPLVATFHEPYDGKRTQSLLVYQLYAPFLAKYDRTIIFCQEQRELLIKLGVPDDRIVVIPNGVDERKYSPGVSNVKAEFGAEQLYVYQGRISTEKNVESLLRAWKKSGMGLDGKCKLVIMGDGSLKASLESFYDRSDGVIWMGVIPDNQRRIDILRGADVFILPSLVEGLSLSLLEGMSCGLACVATDAGANGEVVANGAGVVIDTQGVSTQLRTILPLLRDNPEWRATLGQAARNRVIQNYTLENNLDHVEQIYKEITRTNTISLRLGSSRA
jgi:glycosyltransferase involved in cell wall biosynthesis